MELVVDTQAGAAYVGLTSDRVARTDQFTSGVLVDLDAFGVPVGIEILTLAAEVDVDALAERYGLNDDVRGELRRLLDRAVG